MKHKLIRIAVFAAACILLPGCVNSESRSISLPIEHPEAVQTEDPTRPGNYQPGIPVTPVGGDGISTPTDTPNNPIVDTPTSQVTPNTPSTPSLAVPEPDHSSLLTDYSRKWAYNHLNSAQKAAYAFLFESVKNKQYGYDFPEGLISKKLDVNDVKKVYWAFDYDNAQFIELGNGCGYTYTGSTVTALRASGIRPDENRDNYSRLYSEFDSTVQNILNNALRERSGYDQLLYIHDWIVNNTEYRRNGPQYISEADGPILHGIALCEGYSKAFMYLAQALGYDCVCVAGKANGEDHMWNMVELNGRWYHVDATWDDPVMSDGSSSLRHDYFLISDKSIRKDHYIETPFTIPKASFDYRR